MNPVIDAALSKFLGESLEENISIEDVDHYCESRQNGCSRKLATLLATRSFPGVRTDSSFNSGRCNGNQFEHNPKVGDYYRRRAEAAGVSTTGKFYMAAIANEPGDPQAWVSDRHDVLRVAKERGYRVTGNVEYEPPGFGQAPPSPKIKIAPEIVKEAADLMMLADPDMRPEDATEKATELRSGAIDPHPPRVGEGNPDDHLVDWS